MNAEDAALLPRLIAGDERALRTLVSTHHAALRRFARSIVGDAAAEETVQEAWIKALRALPAFEGRSSLRTWLLTIVRNEAIGRLRKDEREPELVSSDDLGDDFDADGHWRTPPAAWSLDTPEALLAAKDFQAVVDEALLEMPPVQRAVLTLKDVEGLSFDEICNILGLTASNARVLLHRARRRLLAAIDRYQAGDAVPLSRRRDDGQRLRRPAPPAVDAPRRAAPPADLRELPPLPC